MINCLKVCEVFANHMLVLTAGEDEIIKIGHEILTSNNRYYNWFGVKRLNDNNEGYLVGKGYRKSQQERYLRGRNNINT